MAKELLARVELHPVPERAQAAPAVPWQEAGPYTSDGRSPRPRAKAPARTLVGEVLLRCGLYPILNWRGMLQAGGNASRNVLVHVFGLKSGIIGTRLHSRKETNPIVTLAPSALAT